MTCPANSDSSPPPPFSPPSRVRPRVVEVPTEHFITMSRMSRVTGWSPRRIKRFLRRHDATIRVGGRHYTTRDLIRVAFPRVYIALWAKLDALHAE